jgi:hypothetical protein
VSHLFAVELAGHDVTMQSIILMNPALKSPGKVLFLTHTKLLRFAATALADILPENVENYLKK